MALDPEEPECDHEDGHDWQRPHEILGGLKENPGVWGNGGGIIANSCCMRCGCKRTWNSWAQNPETGEQGLDSVEYEPGAYREQLAEMHDSIIRDAIEAAGLEPDNYEFGRIAAPDNDDDDAEATLEKIKSALPDGYCAEWTGDSYTDETDYTTSDIEIGYEPAK